MSKIDGKAILNTIGDVGSAASSVSAIGSAVKGVAGLLGIGRTDVVKQQKQLLDYQNKLNQQNATTAYERQRQLTQDSPLLTKNGLRAAGQNTALGDGTSASAASVQQSSAPSASPLPTSADLDSQYASMANNASSILQNHMSVMADARLKRSQAQLNETDSLTRLSENATRLAKLRGEAKSAEEKAIADRLQRQILQQFGMSDAELENNIKASEAISAAADASIRGEWNKAQYDEKIAQINLLISQKGVTDEQKKNLKEARKNLIAERDEIASRTAKNYSDINVNNAQIPYIKSQKDFVDSQTKYNNQTLNFRVEQERIKTIPSDIKSAMMRSHWVREYINAIENGRKPSYEVKWHFDQLLLEFGVMDSNSFGVDGKSVDAIFR